MRDLVHHLVASGQLSFANGGYVQHDEAASHYVAMIDQTTRGHRCLCCCGGLGHVGQRLWTWSIANDSTQ